MRVIIDIETDRLLSPSKVWVIVCKDLDKGALYVFRNCSEVPSERERFLAFADAVELWIGHNWLEFDYPVLSQLLGLSVLDVYRRSIDTLLVSRLLNYSTPHASAGPGESPAKAVVASGMETKLLSGRHSIESYGLEFGFEKLKFNDFSAYSEEMEKYCLRDVLICEKIYRKYQSQIEDPKNRPSIELEHSFQEVINSLQNNGFAFNSTKAEKLLAKVTSELSGLDTEILKAFPPRLKLVREISPKLTSYGTLNKTDFRWVKDGDLSEFNGGPFCRCSWQVFNPASHRQVIDVLNSSGWSPTDKTQAHIEADRKKDLDKLVNLRIYGWKINENNLSSLSSSAPAPARLLAKRILLESRRRTLTEWLELVKDDGRIHGRFQGIGAWTHRMSHQNPNTANIPNDLDTQGKTKLLGKEMRSLWVAPKNRLLVGVDAEGIQLRIFAHLINDKEFTDALVKGRKEDKTDPHSLNQRILGRVCKSRAAAKRYIYALLLGAGMSKLSQILECSESDCQEALNRLLQRYTGFAKLKESDIPRDAKRGYFVGLDNRLVRIPGDTLSERRHLAMSGYLQNGEAVVMKLATLIWTKEISDAYEKDLLPRGVRPLGMEIPPRPFLVNFVHDEWQTETRSNMAEAIWVAETQSRALQQAGEQLKLRCPLAGSYWNDDRKDYTIGTNWSVTH